MLAGFNGNNPAELFRRTILSRAARSAEARKDGVSVSPRPRCRYGWASGGIEFTESESHGEDPAVLVGLEGQGWGWGYRVRGEFLSKARSILASFTTPASTPATPTSE